MSYKSIQKILFTFDPEISHELTLKLLYWFEKLGLIGFFAKKIAVPIKVMGLHFENPVGLAAGLDKSGDYIDALASLGFGFIEVGSITPKPQGGNPKPRLFRLTEQRAIINRMGFNNKGVDYLVERLQKTQFKGILGINIGKNRDTPLENAVDDYIYVLRCVQRFASYVTINLSSPNTEKLRDLQHGNRLKELLNALKKEQQEFFETNNKYVPLVVKISPDLNTTELNEMVDIFLETRIDGVIATNTTLSRAGLDNSAFVNEGGGLSGKPLTHLSTHIIQQLYGLLQDRIPIIGVGGIMDVKDATEKLHAGARLLQLYSGLIYAGPGLIYQILSSISKDSQLSGSIDFNK